MSAPLRLKPLILEFAWELYGGVGIGQTWSDGQLWVDLDRTTMMNIVVRTLLKSHVC